MNSCNKVLTNEESGQVIMNSCNKIVTKFMNIFIYRMTKSRAVVLFLYFVVEKERK
jgi:hypothetical protein